MLYEVITMWAKDAPPSVVSHPLEMEKEIPTKMIEKSDGRLPMILDVMKRMKKEVGDTTALYGLVCGPFTLASHLRGNMIFMYVITSYSIHYTKLYDPYRLNAIQKSCCHQLLLILPNLKP